MCTHNNIHFPFMRNQHQLDFFSTKTKHIITIIKKKSEWITKKKNIYCKLNSLAPVGFHFSLAKSFSIAFISRQGLSPLQHTENNSQKSESLGMPPPSIFVQSLGTFLPVSGWQWKMDRTTNDERKSKHCTKCSLIKKKKFFGSTVNSTIFFPVGCQNDLNFLWAVLVCSSINCRNKPQPYEKYQPKVFFT